ncbi:MAG: phosphoribosylformylglycinamidine cyclo-ligase [Thermodesulfobacteriota bacterium]
MADDQIEGQVKPKAKPRARKKKAASKKVWTYKDAGVDIEAGAEVVRRIKSVAKTTFDSRVITDIGGFSALYSLNLTKYENPVLVTSCDGVGSKLKVAALAGRHDTIGIDLVAMCVNDILAQGARPLFFLDYLAMSKVEPGLAEQIILGVAAGCREAGCSLIGGETAELPDFYAPGDYDLAGFVVGVVERDEIIDGSEISVGDHLIGLPSSGLHSNGFSLVRKLIFDHLGLGITDKLLSGTVADELLKPTIIYVNTLQVLRRDFKVLGVAHITGGGLVDNVPRILPHGCQAVIRKDSWPRPEIFHFLQQAGQVAEAEMFRTFNMGLGLVLVVPSEQSEEVFDRLRGMGQRASLVGEIQERPPGEAPLLLV